MGVDKECVQANPIVNHYALEMSPALTKNLLPSCPLQYHHTGPSSPEVPNSDNNHITNSYIEFHVSALFSTLYMH